MRLTELPAGSTIVVDANCLIYHFTGTYPSCAVLLERARRRDVRAVTASAPSVSANHVLVTHHETTVEIVDLESRNGTWLELMPNRPVSQAPPPSLRIHLAPGKRSLMSG